MDCLRIRFLTCAVLAALVYAVPAAGQTGQVTGLVRARGIASSGARVTATNQATGAVTRATSGTDGKYTISGLAPGAYTVAASLPGLRSLSNRDVQVASDVAATVDFDLQPLTLEAITVTAMLREQELAKVPFSIAAPTQEALRVRGADNIEAVAANVADFSVQNLGPGQSQVAMRGVSSGQIARDQPGVKEEVGAYLDDVPISLSLFTPDLDLFDVARVEVLRGPQGTLFGSGSLGGTVRYITNQPVLREHSTVVETGVSWINGGSPGNDAKLAFNVPLGDKAAVRIAGYSNQLGGYMDAVQPNFTVSKDVNGGARTGARVAFRIAPSGRFTITPRILFQRVKMDGWNRIDAFNILANPYTTSRPPVSLGDRQLFTQINEPFTDDFLLGDLTARLDLGKVSVTSISSYTHRFIQVVRDAGALTSSITGGSLGLPASVYTLNAPLNDVTKSGVSTQEVRLSGGQGRVHFVVGGFYAGNRRHYGQDLLVAGFDTLAAPLLGAPNGFSRSVYSPKDHLFWSDLHYYLKQTAAFGEATVPVGDRLDLTGGIRYYKFDEQRDQIFDGLFGQDNNGKPQIQPGATKAHGFAPRFIASYKASDAVTVNAQASRGFRLGGINDPLNVTLCTAQDLAVFSGHDSWKDEKVWNYEVGVKAQSGRSTFNLSAFDMEITDLQLTVTAGSCSSRLILNAPKARSQGVEAEITLSPDQHWDFALSAAFNNGKLGSDLKDGSGNIISGIKSGNRLPAALQAQASGAITYGWLLAAGSRADISGSFSYNGSRYTLIDDEASGAGTVNLNSFGAHTIGGPLTQSTFTYKPLLPGYGLVNLRAGLSREKWGASIFVTNLTDTRALLALDRERGTRARVGYLTNQPRTFGVTLNYTY